MAHYAFVNDSNIVVDVIVGKDESEIIDGLSPEEWYGNFRNLRCIRTSYNANIRKNYAGIGYKYDVDLDAFIAPQPFSSWVLDEETCQWQAPVPMPNDEKMYYWNEELQEWVENVIS